MALDARVQARLDETLVAGGFEMPVLPDAVLRLVAETRKPDADMTKVTELVRRDPSLAGNLLGLANTVTFAGREPAATLSHAVSRLGLEALCQLALVVAARTKAFRVAGREAEMQAMFARAFATALYAQEIARARRLGVEQAFLGGLFHDVGRPLVLQLAIDAHADLGLEVDDAAVGEAVDALHAEIGARMIEAWKLGAGVVAAVRYHHDFTHDRGAALAALADVLAGVALGDPTIDDVRVHASLPALGLYTNDVDRLLAMGPTIAERVAQVV